MYSFKKDLLTHCKLLTNEERVIIIGNTSNVGKVSVKDMKTMFKKKFYFPFPDYGARSLLFKDLVQKAGGSLTENFNLNTMAHITERYPTGSVGRSPQPHSCLFSKFQQVIEKVLTERRLKKLEQKPLELKEFIGPLSTVPRVDDNDYQSFRVRHLLNRR